MEQPLLPKPPPLYQIHFERTGGFAGLRIAATIDSTKISSEEALRLQENLSTAGFFNLPAKLASPSVGADRFQYRITVEEAGRTHTVEFSEAAAPEAIQPLIRQLTVLARQGNRG